MIKGRNIAILHTGNEKTIHKGKGIMVGAANSSYLHVFDILKGSNTKRPAHLQAGTGTCIDYDGKR